MTTERKKFPLVIVLSAIGAVALIVTILFTLSGGSEYGSPSVTGDSLPPYSAQGDTGAGLTIPTVVGADFDGTTQKIEVDGTPKILVFLAHWCPHCQNEAPLVQQWVDDGGLPDGIDMITVATGITPTRDNFPPSEWLKGIDWSSPVIVDDKDNTVGNAFGLTAFPYWVFVNSEGTVLARTTGELPTSTLDQAVLNLMTSG